MKGAKRKYTTITIPTALFDNIKKEIASTGFSSVSDYATYILRETTSEACHGQVCRKQVQERNSREAKGTRIYSVIIWQELAA